MESLPSEARANAVTIVSARIRIDAPVSTVWNVILDFPSYPLWNAFVRTQAITDASFKPLLAHPQPKEGDRLLLHVRIPPVGLHDNDKGLRPSKEIITVVDETNHRISWIQAGMPSWLLRAVRWQELVEEHIDGRTTTTYMTAEAFSGPLAWIIRWFLYGKLMLSFKIMAEGLKQRSEELAMTERGVR